VIDAPGQQSSFTRPTEERADDPIVISGLVKSYGPHRAVDDVSFRVHAGEVFALLGPNGAGKTTTVEILEGIRSRDGGTVTVLGEDPARDRRAWRARIGVVPQGAGAYDDLTVREVVTHFAAMYPHPLGVDQMIEMVGLTGKAGARATSLSGGQQRRLDVAVGVVGDPALIFLDEPTTGLDPEARREAWQLVRFFAERGATTVLTTHYLDEADALAQRAAVIVAGRIVAYDEMADLGGRSSTPTRVSFRPPAHLAGESVRALGPGADLDADGRAAVQTATPTAVLEAAIGWSHSAGIGELPELRVQRQTLEDVYLDLIHRSESEPHDV
jgi:ABC-2 type transport system ATP-binding protein